MSAKDRATEIYQQHIAMASVDGRLFRKTVMDQLVAETGCSVASAATHYNNCKKAMPVQGLGRAAPANRSAKATGRVKAEPLLPDNQCFTVLELVDGAVGRCQSFELQGDASEKFDEKTYSWPKSTWILIQGLGPNSGETYKLDSDEKEVRRYTPQQA